MAESGEGLTPENIDEHRAAVPGIFGDTPTAGLGSTDHIVTKNQEEAGVNVAEADESDEDNTDAEAVRQVDAAAPSGAFAEEVDEAADDDEDGDDDGDDEGDSKTAADVVSEIESAETVEEVDALADGDERVTVQRAADKKREELSE